MCCFLNVTFIQWTTLEVNKNDNMQCAPRELDSYNISRDDEDNEILYVYKYTQHIVYMCIIRIYIYINFLL